MRWLSAFVSLLSVGALAAKKAPEDTFTKYHAKSLSSTPVKLADPSFKDLTGAPRDYSVAVLLTALESRFGCQVCREFQPEWELLSKSWTRGDKAGQSRLVFGTLDFSDGRDTFLGVSLL
jgi:oligosaccharyltransferase complex subunit gamma